VKTYKATAISPANIAFIKYWGWKNENDKALILPANDSISMNLSNCLTTTTVEFSPHFTSDSVKIAFFGQEKREATEKQREKVLHHVNRLKKTGDITLPVKIVSHNSFPSDAGIASSASAFSALTAATAHALGFAWDTKKLSIETRLSGSGSACRSIVDGFAYWQKDTNSENCYAYQLKDETWWDLADIVVVLDSHSKKISSLDGHQLATTSPYYQVRLQELPARIKKIKQAVEGKDFTRFGTLIEQEAISMHAICMTSQPPLFYWNHGTLEVILALQQWRKTGLMGYFTIDAGPNLHIICQKKDANILNQRLQALNNVSFTIVNTPCKGTRIIDNHLF